MTEERDPADLEPLRWELQTQDGRTVTVELPWRSEIGMLELLIERNRLRVIARQEQAGFTFEPSPIDGLPEPRKRRTRRASAPAAK